MSEGVQWGLFRGKALERQSSPSCIVLRHAAGCVARRVAAALVRLRAELRGCPTPRAAALGVVTCCPHNFLFAFNGTAC